MVPERRGGLHEPGHVVLARCVTERPATRRPTTRGACVAEARTANEIWVWRLRGRQPVSGAPRWRDEKRRTKKKSVVSPAGRHGPRRSEGDARRRGWTKSEPPPRADVSDGRARVYDACVRRTSRRVAACGEATTRVACALPSHEAPRGVYSLDARARRANARLGGQKQRRARRRDEFPGRAGQDRARGRPRVRPRRVFAARFKTPDAASSAFFAL